MKVQKAQAQDPGRTAIADACDEDDDDELHAFLAGGGSSCDSRRLAFLQLAFFFRPLIPETMYLPHFAIF